MKRSIKILLHAGYWILYLLLISSFLIILGASSKQPISATFKIIAFESPLLLMTILPGVLCFYSCYAVLFPRWLTQQRLFPFFVGILIAALISGVIPILLLYLPGFPWKVTERFDKWLIIWGMLSLLAIIHGVIGLVLRGFITWYGEIKIKADLEKKNMQTELALIKSQLNPHFLFNTINNIDVLIETDASRASVYLNKLSGLLRFLLYDAQPEWIPLEKEISYIEQYLDLQRIRTANPDFIQYKVTGNPANRTIAPVLFISYIENAFKHGEQLKASSPIIVNIDILENHIHFFCSNKYRKNNTPGDHSGLGNELLLKRLELLYPGSYELKINNQDQTYSVDLLIFDHESGMYSSGR
jgi:two-component system LytT family sensor kinase